MTLDDRPRGILSPSDREYLKNPDEFSSQAAYERRRAIVERVYESMYDYELLLNDLDPKVRREIFDKFDPDDFSLNTLEWPVAFFYLGIGDAMDSGDLVVPAFVDLISEGIRQAFLQRGETAWADVEIDIKTGGSVEELEKEVKSGELSPSEIWKAWELVRQGKMTFSEYKQLLPDDE